MIVRSTQDDSSEVFYIVILNEVKNLLSGNTLSTLSMVGFEEILRCAQDDSVCAWIGVFLMGAAV